METKLSGQAITVAVVEGEPLLLDLLRVALQLLSATYEKWQKIPSR